MDPPSESFIDLSTMEALEYKDGNASHIAFIHVSDPQQLDPMQSQGRQQQVRHPQNRQQQDRQRQARHQESQQEDPKQYQESSQQKNHQKKMDPPFPNHSSIFRRWKPWNTKTETVYCHLTLLLFTFLTHNNWIRDLAAIVHHRQLLPLFAIHLCIHLTKNSSKQQLPLSAFIAFLVLQTICRLPFRCCTDMRSIVVLLSVPDSVSTKHSVGMGYDVLFKYTVKVCKNQIVTAGRLVTVLDMRPQT